MRVLLDECVDWRLSRDVIGHDVKTARQMGWATIKNGELLALAAQQFDVFVTVDRNLSFQQNLVAFPVAVIVLRARTNRLVDLRPLVPALLAALQSPHAWHGASHRKLRQIQTPAHRLGLLVAVQPAGRQEVAPGGVSPGNQSIPSLRRFEADAVTDAVEEWLAELRESAASPGETR